ncbi:MAG: hypothetical protein O2958_07715 [Gemmatimonadetes bacterium]|nr:hypothetical protein [Gemmatimonadota bacterium]MDA1104216.1 hypothetical protein [Gemmatimonadota bacterium]
MSDAERWLDARRPVPPQALDAALRSAVGPVETPEALLAAAVARLDAALSRPGRVRESAFDLLVADAVTTYACEAALESSDPETALKRLLEVGDAR